MNSYSSFNSFLFDPFISLPYYESSYHALYFGCRFVFPPPYLFPFKQHLYFCDLHKSNHLNTFFRFDCDPMLHRVFIDQGDLALGRDLCLMQVLRFFFDSLDSRGESLLPEWGRCQRVVLEDVCVVSCLRFIIVRALMVVVSWLTTRKSYIGRNLIIISA